MKPKESIQYKFQKTKKCVCGGAGGKKKKSVRGGK